MAMHALVHPFEQGNPNQYLVSLLSEASAVSDHSPTLLALALSLKTRLLGLLLVVMVSMSGMIL